MMFDWAAALQKDGYFLLPRVLSPGRLLEITTQLETALAQDRSGNTLRTEDGIVFRARNLHQLWPAVLDVWREPPLQRVVRETLGTDAGLVRVLYFDKPPGHSWALPWHKDMTIAVRNNRLPSEAFAKPTFKAGVPHVEAPESLLARMLTLRLHLDPATEENGALKVMPGSHHTGKATAAGGGAMRTVVAAAGDALVMRPLVSHASNKSHDDCQLSRRVLHFEFAADPELPDGYAWHDHWPALALAQPADKK